MLALSLNHSEFSILNHYLSASCYICHFSYSDFTETIFDKSVETLSFQKQILTWSPPSPNTMLEDDENTADEFITMFSAVKPTLKWGEGVIGSTCWKFASRRGFSIHKAHVSQRLLSKILGHLFCAISTVWIVASLFSGVNEWFFSFSDCKIIGSYLDSPKWALNLILLKTDFKSSY